MRPWRSILAAPLLLGPLATSAATGVIGHSQATRKPTLAALGMRDAPLSLTASDGTGLRLLVVEADAVLDPPLAFTELRLTFENPDDRRVEGTFRLRLPPGAAISRFAMKTGDRWQEGEVVERQKARRAYEDFLHRRQDPALLEQQRGNEWSARVFPIEPRERKELIVSYSEELRGGAPYRLPLVGLPRVERLDAGVLVPERASQGGSSLGGTTQQQRRVTLVRSNWRPDADLEVETSNMRDGSGLRHGDLLVASVRPEVNPPPDPVAALAILVDSSASRALGFEAQLDLVAALAARLGESSLTVAAFDQEVELLYRGPADGLDEAALGEARRRLPLGASDLERVLEWLGSQPDPPARVLLVTDGMATAGAVEPESLVERVADLADGGVERLDVLAVGGLRDDVLLSRLVTAGLPRAGAVLDAEGGVDEVLARLGRATAPEIAVDVPGARWFWPASLRGVQPGDEVLVYAELSAEIPFRLRLDGHEVMSGGLVPTERPLLDRACVVARIERLLRVRDDALARGDADVASAIERQVVALSEQHRVLTPWTAFVVLETEADYERFGIDRTALADILTVGPGGLRVLERDARSLPPLTGQRALELRDPLERARPGDTDPGAGPEEALPVEAMAETFEEAGRPLPPPPPPPPPPPAPTPPPPSGAAVREEIPPSTEEVTVTAESTEVQMAAAATRRTRPGESDEEDAPVLATPPWSGRYAAFRSLLDDGRTDAALAEALRWVREEPGEVLAYVALGEALGASGESGAARRAYGSLIDLFPSRADLRRYAGQRLQATEGGLELALDTFRAARASRPDHPSSHRFEAFALLRAGRIADAFEVLAEGLGREYPRGRFAGVEEVLREDAGLVAAAWIRDEPDRRDEILERLRLVGGRLEVEPSTRFILTWETDANDVDLHVWDAADRHAYYENMALPGGRLYADVTTGYGPECFAFRESATALPLRIQVHYYNRGPMGYGLGQVEIVRHDGRGRLELETRPFVVMNDDAFVDLGTLPR